MKWFNKLLNNCFSILAKAAMDGAHLMLNMIANIVSEQAVYVPTWLHRIALKVVAICSFKQNCELYYPK